MSSRSAIALSMALGILSTSGAAQTTANPAATAAVDRGRVLFEQHCAVCHGKEGKGDGPAASGTARKPTNVTLMQKRHGAFFAAQAESAIRGTDPVVAHGVPAMLVWGAIFRAHARGDEAAVAARIRDLVAFMESIQEK
jgi:mono/diheme cytochrome c family protein